jgi:hypothetical protein
MSHKKKSTTGFASVRIGQFKTGCLLVSSFKYDTDIIILLISWLNMIRTLSLYSFHGLNMICCLCFRVTMVLK